MACIQGDVVSAAFQQGMANFTLDFLPAELDDSALADVPSEQNASLMLSLPSCSKPRISVNHFLGTPEEGDMGKLTVLLVLRSALAEVSVVVFFCVLILRFSSGAG